MPTPQQDIAVRFHWTLRIAAGMCFIGHGAWGILQKDEWVQFFTPFGISEGLAYDLMPLIGTMDITMGLFVLVRPTPIFLGFMAFWGVWTAFLRPISGHSWYEVLERAGNYGVPALMLLIGLTASQVRVGMFSRLGPTEVSLGRAIFWKRTLLWITALLLLGHGGFGADLAKETLRLHWGAVGLGTVEWVRAAGAFEIVLAILVVCAPSRRLMLAVLGWKLFTELLYPMTGGGIWEFVERGGSYGAPLGAYYLMEWIERLKRDAGESDDRNSVGNLELEAPDVTPR